MNSVDKFNALNGKKADFDELLDILEQAKEESQKDIVERLSKIVAYIYIKVDDNFKIKIAPFAKWTDSENKGLNAPRHDGLAKKALTECGRLRPGYKYIKGGKIEKVQKAKKKDASTAKKRVAAGNTKKSVTGSSKSKKQRVAAPKFETKKRKTDSISRSKANVLKKGENVPKKVKKTPAKQKTVTKKQKSVIKKKKNGLAAPIVLDNGANTVIVPRPTGDNGDTPVQVLDIPVIAREIVPATPEATPKKVVQQRPFVKRKNLGPIKKMTDVGSQTNELFVLDGDLGRFMGALERKPSGSVVCTLDAPQGAMKTRLFFQKMNTFASSGYNVLFLSLEEHPESKLFKDKRDQYIDPKNQSRIDTIGELPGGIKDFTDAIPFYDAIFTDSWGKLLLLHKGLDLDKDFRRKYHGKFFDVIYQRTSSGKMRGGSASQFDADIVMKVEKDPFDYKNNYAYFDKNRYEQEPGLKYNIYSQKLEGGEDSFSDQSEELPKGNAIELV